MSFRKLASGQVLDVRLSKRQLNELDFESGGFARLSKATTDDAISSDGYLYVRTRAISSRVNKNNDGWPSEELAKSFKSFEGRPIFIDHNNDDPSRTRGVVAWSKLHVDDEKISALDPYYSTAPDNHKPPTWIELMLEVDAQAFPKLADHIISGNIDSVSMGANIERSVCSVCSHEARNPSEYCDHINNKGIEFEVVSATGEKQKKLAYEDCHDIAFFEISFVFDPADDTALISEMKPALAKVASEAPDEKEGDKCGTTIEYGKTEKTCKLPAGHDGPHEWGKEVEKKTADVSCPSCGTAMSGDTCSGCDYVPPSKKKKKHKKTTEYKYVKQRGDKWVIVQKGTGKVLSTHDSEEKAQSAFRAMEMNMHGGSVRTTALPPESQFQIGQKVETANGERGRILAYVPIATVQGWVRQGQFDPEFLQHFPAEGYFAFQNDRDGDRYLCPANLLKPVNEEFDANPHLTDDDIYKGLNLSHKKKAAPPGTDLHHDLEGRGGSPEEAPGNVRVRNYEPQSEMTTSPKKVDTLRSDHKCPDCGSELEEKNRGIYECPVCGYQQEPDQFDNPDLSRARDVDAETQLHKKYEEEQEEAATPEPEVRPDQAAQTQPSSLRPINPVMPMAAGTLKRDASKGGIVDMNFTVTARAFVEGDDIENVLTLESKTAAPKKPVLNTKKKGSDEPSDPRIKSDQLAPVESSSKEHSMDKSADREVIKRVEEDGAGVKRTEEITKEFGALGESTEEPDAEEVEGEEPKAEDSSAPDSDTDSESEDDTSSDPFSTAPDITDDDTGTKKLMAALRLAKLASEMGVITHEDELDFAAKIEDETMPEIAARMAMLSTVKEAGLAKSAPRMAFAHRFPSTKVAAANNNSDDIPDEALFI